MSESEVTLRESRGQCGSDVRRFRFGTRSPSTVPVRPSFAYDSLSGSSGADANGLAAAAFLPELVARVARASVVAVFPAPGLSDAMSNADMDCS